MDLRRADGDYQDSCLAAQSTKWPTGTALSQLDGLSQGFGSSWVAGCYATKRTFGRDGEAAMTACDHIPAGHSKRAVWQYVTIGEAWAAGPDHLLAKRCSAIWMPLSAAPFRRLSPQAKRRSASS
jgi:hypothetical protein